MGNKRKGKKKSKVFLLILLIIIAAGIYVGKYLSDKLGKINFQEIDKTDLSVNDKLYDEVSDVLSRAEFENIITIALFGTDSRDSNNISSGRSDTIIIAAINTNSKKIKLISIPRDTYVEVPGHGNTKINHAYAYRWRSTFNKNN